MAAAGEGSLSWSPFSEPPTRVLWGDRWPLDAGLSGEGCVHRSLSDAACGFMGI